MTSRRPGVVVLDYGSGNLRSAQRALQRAGADTDISADPGAALRADGLVVPGVGAFAACMAPSISEAGATSVPIASTAMVCMVPARGRAKSPFPGLAISKIYSASSTRMASRCR